MNDFLRLAFHLKKRSGGSPVEWCLTCWTTTSLKASSNPTDAIMFNFELLLLRQELNPLIYSAMI